MKMKTRERILHSSLALFNDFGESNVTTLQIADELDISPGNLYYHFRSKGDIVNELYGWYEDQVSELLDVPEVAISMEDHWLFLHLLFETIARFRFLYQDLVNVLSRYNHLQNRFQRVLRRKHKACHRINSSLRQQSMLRATDAELDSLSDQVVLTLTYWLSYEMLTHLQNKDEVDLGRGVYQVMSLLAPFLREDERQMLEQMREDYC